MRNTAASSVPVAKVGGFYRRLWSYIGPGLLVSVGYMDPGNWATDLAGGARYGYTLLSVVLLSSLFAMLLQHLALRLGIATGKDLAQACREQFSRRISLLLWILAEIAIAACDLAEVIGSAIALNLLFGLPITFGVLLTTVDVLLVLLLQQRGMRAIEAFIAGLVFVIGICFAYELLLSPPDALAMLKGLVPSPEIISDPGMLYVAIGILGATVMPHNLYLHSSIVQTRAYPRSSRGKLVAIHYASRDSNYALVAAFFVNAAILLMSASTFHNSAHQDLASIEDAYQLLTPLLGASLASFVFGVALLASGQSSTITGTMAGQIVMEGFLSLRLRPWVRQLISRALAMGPAVVAAFFFGMEGVGKLLIFSQVVLSLQLGFAVVPLVWFTSNKRLMGRFVISPRFQVIAWAISVIIILLNVYLLYQTVFGR